MESCPRASALEFPDDTTNDPTFPPPELVPAIESRANWGTYLSPNRTFGFALTVAVSDGNGAPKASATPPSKALPGINAPAKAFGTPDSPDAAFAARAATGLVC